MFHKGTLCNVNLNGYDTLIFTCHDIRLHSRLTGHEWLIVTYYGSDICEIRHRHSSRDPFHHQRGSFKSLSDAITYIRQHDHWYYSHKMTTHLDRI